MTVAGNLCRRHSTLILGGCVFLGVLFPRLAELLSPLLMPSVFVLMVFALLAIHPHELRQAMARVPLLAAASFWQLGVFPLLVAFTLWAAPVPPFLWTPLLVSACASPIFSSPAFARIVGLDAALATAVVVATTVLMPVSLLAYTTLLTSLAFELDLLEYAWRVTLFLLVPLLLARLLRYGSRTPWFQCLQARLDLLTIAALVVFAVAVMDGVAAQLHRQPAQVLAYLIAAFGINLYAQLTTWLVFAGTGKATAWTIALTAGFRNMALILAITGTMLGSDFLVFVGVAQIPMYVLPLLMRPLYSRLTGNVSPART